MLRKEFLDNPALVHPLKVYEVCGNLSVPDWTIKRCLLSGCEEKAVYFADMIWTTTCSKEEKIIR